MKKLLCILLALTLMLGSTLAMVSCDETKDPEKTEGNATKDTEDSDADDKKDTEAEDTKAEDTEAEDTEKTEDTPDTEKPESDVSGDLQVYSNGDISFSYPNGWTETEADGVVMIINETGVGNNITVVSEPVSDIYSTMTIDSFESLFVPTYEAMGFEISNVSIEQLKNENGLDITKITFTTVANGVTMVQTQLIHALGNLNYAITVTILESDPDSDLVETVFNSLEDVK